MTKAQQIVVASAVVAVISIAGYGFRYSLGIVQGSEDAQEQLELWKKNGFPLKEEDVFIGGRTPDEENAAIALMNIIEGPAPKLTLPASIKKSDWEAGTVQAYLESRQSLIQDIEQAGELTKHQPNNLNVTSDFPEHAKLKQWQQLLALDGVRFAKRPKD